ncbi:hypothetical protein LMXM_33_2515 [Leishmania mexicana MHOM/GT/2001/U1103]|uniref:Uncharacterized protein n=1 Tax=Leishmania mexicana (strain MHOM/GT/2001/U1103) TaxID=929439 RepID=E9B542_LEIMU|nr:hypothetical protein LMXM_33_2515 [Leishmania mexicana MHOM/GT/2001/U1103]CBZ30361.1 hypothetical protein LMXM_33_2515 [Leishmania mexicana MHOM/GT/2001/U1103]
MGTLMELWWRCGGTRKAVRGVTKCILSIEVLGETIEPKPRVRSTPLPFSRGAKYLLGCCAVSMRERCCLSLHRPPPPPCPLSLFLTRVPRSASVLSTSVELWHGEEVCTRTHTIVRLHHILFSPFASHLHFPASPSSPLRATVCVCVCESRVAAAAVAVGLCSLPPPFSIVFTVSQTCQSAAGVRGRNLATARGRKAKRKKRTQRSRRTTKNKNVEAAL